MGEAKNSFICLIKVDFIDLVFKNANFRIKMPVATEAPAVVEETIPAVPAKKVEKERIRSFGPDKAEVVDDVEVQYCFWGAELSCSSPMHSWRIFHPEDECEDDLRHLLFLKQATLGVNAIPGERNIVQVTSKDYEGNVVRQVLCSLTLGQGLGTTDLDLVLQYDHEVSFKLIKGAGPVHLVGNHYVETPEKEAEEEYETEEDADGKAANGTDAKCDDAEAMEN